MFVVRNDELISERNDFSFLTGTVYEILSKGVPVKESYKPVLNKAKKFIVQAKKGEKVTRQVCNNGFSLTDFEDVKSFRWAFVGLDDIKADHEIQKLLNLLEKSLIKLIDGKQVAEDEILSLKNFFSLIYDYTLENSNSIDNFLLE